MPGDLGWEVQGRVARRGELGHASWRARTGAAWCGELVCQPLSHLHVGRSAGWAEKCSARAPEATLKQLYSSWQRMWRRSALRVHLKPLSSKSTRRVVRDLPSLVSDKIPSL